MVNYKNNLRLKKISKELLIKSLSWIAFIISAYIFSRLTIDDAFISWRHGYNLINSGFFNYNPSNIDLTQSYTNSIYAILSIIPAALGIDVVLFFKIFSIITVFIFLQYLHTVHKIGYTAAAFLAIPASMIHISSGLETFLFVALIVFLYDSLKQDNLKKSILLTSLLFTVRPESFLLAILIPLYFISEREGGLNPIYKFKSLFKLKEKSRYFSFILPAILFTILALHKSYFGSYLPNTFYIKSINVSFGYYDLFDNITRITMLALPALCFLSLTAKNKNTSLFYVFFILFLGMTINYTLSELSMNYALRFIFHIYAPIFFILLIEQKNTLPQIKVMYKNITSELNIFGVAAALLFSIFFTLQFKPNELLELSQYYPRAQLSHSELGYAIKDSGAKSMSFGDAGMTAFNAKIDSLDNIGLGSSLVAKYGVNNYVLDIYNPDIVVFHSRPEIGIRMDDHNQKNIFTWVEKNNLQPVCEAIWDRDYSITIYAKKNIDVYPIKKTCKKSKFNMRSKLANFKKYVMSPPWIFWNSQKMQEAS